MFPAAAKPRPLFSCRSAKHSGEVCLSHEITIALPRGTASLIDCPHHQALSAPAVTRGKNSRNIGCELSVLGLSIGTRITLHAELRENRIFGSEEAHRQQYKVRGDDFVGARYPLWNESALLIFHPLYVVNVQLFHLAVAVADKFLAGGEIDARIGSKPRFDFLLTVIQFVNLRPFGPRVIGLAFVRRPRQN